MESQELIVRIDFVDRPGLGYDIFQRFETHNTDKIGMEVTHGHQMMIKFRCSNQEESETLIQDLLTVQGVVSVKLANYMPYEKREQELKTILDLVSEGIIAINTNHKVTHINEVAARIFYTTPEKALNQDAEFLFEANAPIFETLKTGIPYSLKERKIRRNQRLIHFLTSGVPILNKRGQIIGGVMTIKDFRQVEELLSKVERKPQSITFDNIIYESRRMRDLIETAKTVARGTSTILLRGESGTGKELFAKAIHAESPRSQQAFIPINCAALPDTLLESELFGYEEGAFTGATKGGKKGLFEQAHGGTLFLDEIGDITPQVQVRLLRVLQEGTVRRIGSSKEIPVDVRIIAATHRNLEALIDEDQFREDLYYRLNVIPLHIPSLRERPEDIPLIAQTLTRKIAKKLDKSEVYLTKESTDLLMAQKWPGNVRQLENLLERIINLNSSSEIKPSSFYEWADLAPAVPITKPESTAHQLIVPITEPWPPLKEIVAQVEREVLLKVLAKHPSSRKAGKILGVSNTTILNKMNSYGLGKIDEPEG
ncbi:MULTISPECIES: sigma 54-interacting transcriptional regulator [Desulfitobacterium]|uniref:HTH-type transcriptional regulatory protein TyrR n=1 Tax=Desulfitobacterium dehalogenans (strain ATCC 51507 / DSM 9161 / JW/IU-DC1) TaxID=756499 RepID=I4A6V5_DESDJ|nr:MULTISPECIES: sigma 54-interacting transcriptional regulator [Desulfitobacterium]AFL99689.1 transcriptional regulator containing PAS, AAA-type ATPase, and DNA-binding domains [Desulfitobacterium dehalogenans ATCC 51507]